MPDVDNGYAFYWEPFSSTPILVDPIKQGGGARYVRVDDYVPVLDDDVTVKALAGKVKGASSSLAAGTPEPPAEQPDDIPMICEPCREVKGEE